MYDQDRKFYKVSVVLAVSVDYYHHTFFGHGLSLLQQKVQRHSHSLPRV